MIDIKTRMDSDIFKDGTQVSNDVCPLEPGKEVKFLPKEAKI
jgi:hypothetical protein